MLILGSESPRRLELLKRVGIKIDKVVAPKICEEVRNGELPRDYVLRVAIAKNSKVLAALEDFLITADTAVIKGRRILGKPDNAIEAKNNIKPISSR